MSRLSAEQSVIARKNRALFLRRLSEKGQTHTAAALEVSDATIHRWTKAEELADRSRMTLLEGICEAAAVLGIKFVPTSAKCYAPNQIGPLLELARQRVESLKSVDDLDADDPE